MGEAPRPPEANLRAERPAHKPNQRFERGARTVYCANAQKDRAPEGARFPLSVSLQVRDCFDFIPQRRGEFRGG